MTAYDELTKSPVPVPIVRPEGRSDTVWSMVIGSSPTSANA